MQAAVGRWRHLPRFGAVAVVAGLCIVNAPASAGTADPIIEALRADEAEFVTAMTARDTVWMQKLAWRNRRASFAFVKNDPPIKPDDPEAVAVRRAHVACANAHSGFGMLMHVSVAVLMSNTGSGNVTEDNKASRGSFNFFQPSYLKRRAQCADLNKRDLGTSPLADGPDAVFPPFELVQLTTISTADRAALTAAIEGALSTERKIATARGANDVPAIEALLPELHAPRLLLNRLDSPDLSRRDYTIIKECRWATGDLLTIARAIHEAIDRPDVRDTYLENSNKQIVQYRHTKRACVAVLGLPDTVAEVGIAPTE